MTARGLPHSEILGSSLVSSSPKLIAACYVLHRLECQGIHLCALILLLFLRRKESVPHPFGHATLLEIAPTLCGRAAFHVWHMKVLLYAVFKDRGVDYPRYPGPKSFKRSGTGT